MKYEIFGGSFPAAEVTLNNEEKVYTQSGAMAWGDSDIEMSTNMEGGFLKSLGRMFSGTSLMLVTHTAHRDNSKITFSSAFPGTIKEFTIDANHEYYAQKSAFLVADTSVAIDASVNKNFWAGLFGGEGFVLQKFSGNGILLAEIDGSIKEVELQAGQSIKVETGHVALFESSVNYEVQTVKGFKNIFFGGEGLFMVKLTGPGKVWLQTLTARDMAEKLIPYLPKATTTTVHTSSHNDNN